MDDVSGSADGATAMQVVDHRETAHDLLVRRERFGAIERAMNQLPLKQKQVFMMFHAEGTDYEQIATELKIPVGTVKSRLNRARLGIRKTIGAKMNRTPAVSPLLPV